MTTQPAPPPRFIRSTTRRADLAVVLTYNIKALTTCREVGLVGGSRAGAGRTMRCIGLPMFLRSGVQ
ncbi:MAG TPA: hypothetical protein VHJ18_26155 [Streptosporangiaceae bacterium]|nr:hypothetical protein [Streptosporangiaceae bacterium]